MLDIFRTLIDALANRLADWIDRSPGLMTPWIECMLTGDEEIDAILLSWYETNAWMPDR